jgi:hypothetical protein
LFLLFQNLNLIRIILFFNNIFNIFNTKINKMARPSSFEITIKKSRDSKSERRSNQSEIDDDSKKIHMIVNSALVSLVLIVVVPSIVLAIFSYCNTI